jgi:hypothetical protein
MSNHHHHFQNRGALAMRRIFVLFTLGLLSWSLFSATSNAIPAFARKYGFNCNMCHSGFTRLNDLGQRYRDNGYQIPGQEGKEKTVFDAGPPIALRTTTGFSSYTVDKNTSSSFNVFGLDLLAAGVFHKNVSFLMIYTPRIDEPAADFNGAGNGTNPSQLGALESVSIVFSNIVEDVLNVRIGRFEPAYHPFSSKRKYTLFEPYEIYSFATPISTFLFDDNQIGVEASGHFRSGFKYAAGAVNGNGANPDNNNAKDLYARVSQTIGKGDGQTAGQRIGLLGYYGWQPSTLAGKIPAPTGETNGKANGGFYRIGIDGSFNYDAFNLGLLYLTGLDDKPLNNVNPLEDYKFSGGLAELNWAGLMNDRMIVSFLYNWVRPPSYDDLHNIDAYTTLVRYYLGDWSALNVGLHAEYTYRETGNTSIRAEHLVALAVDFAF